MGPTPDMMLVALLQQIQHHPLYKPVTTESYFKTAPPVRDWRDYHFCGRMFHPPLLASN